MLEKHFIGRAFRIGACGSVILLCATQGSSEPEPLTKRACKVAYKSALEREESGRLREARDLFSRCSAATCGKVRAECKSSYALLNSDIPSVVPVVTDEEGELVFNVQVTMDGEVLTSRADGRPIVVDPGGHEFSFSTADGVFAKQNVMIRRGQRNLTLPVSIQSSSSDKRSAKSVAPSPKSVEPTRAKPSAKAEPKEAAPAPSVEEAVHEATPPETVSTGGPGALPYVIGGAGLAAIGTGAMLTVWGRKDNDLLRGCAPYCAQASVDRVSALYTASTVSIGVGVAAIGVAAFLFATSGSSGEKPPARSAYFIDVQPAPSGAFATVSGAF
jgi:hypothetical protein